MKQFVISLLLGPPWPTAAVFGLSVVVVVVVGGESDCTCHNRVALGDTGGELGAGAGGEARLHVLQAAVQGRERVLVRLWTNMQQMQESVSAEKCAKWLDRYSKNKTKHVYKP